MHRATAYVAVTLCAGFAAFGQPSSSPDAIARGPGQPAIAGFVVDHTAVDGFDRIDDALLPRAAALHALFRHASVGTTIDDGLDCLQGTRSSPSECTQYAAYRYDRRNWSFQPRPNSGWFGKVDDFASEVRAHAGEYDVLMFKFCYLDGLDGLQEPCGSAYSDAKVQLAFETLRDTLDTLQDAYPEKTFVWWTIPLTQIGQYCTDTLNALIRDYARTHGKILFDIADIEMHDADGNPSRNANGWEIAYKPFCGEQAPDASACHPNWTGKVRLARAFWVLMTRIAAERLQTAIGAVSQAGWALEVFPNPARSAATISYRVPAGARATLIVRDVFGRSVLVRTARAEGGAERQLTFDTGTLPAGAYFCTVATPHGSATRAFSILR